MRPRVLWLLSTLTVAPAAFAHGENLIWFAGTVLVGIPAALFLLVPWHRWWARLLVVLVLAVGNVLVWWFFSNHAARVSSGCLGWLILFSPLLVAVTFAISLRGLCDRRYPPPGSFSTSF